MFLVAVVPEVEPLPRNVIVYGLPVHFAYKMMFPAGEYVVSPAE
jgi:hypothetical protein